jgi:hypothetical protein
MSSINDVLAWAMILIATWGIILAGIRAREWWRDHIRPDPLAPEIETYYSAWGKLR